jgi:single-stranded DNA-specific DHH superfamily exonuclease
MDNFIFSAGSKNKFTEFIQNLSKKDRVALISHIDLDGITSAKVVNLAVSQIVKPKIIKFVGYDEINLDFVLEIRKLKINKIIFSDLAIDDLKVIQNLEKFADILIIDHHLFNENLNSDKTVFINIQGQCASYICYSLFYNFSEDLEKIDWLVACACLADWLYFNNQDFMKKTFAKYRDNFEIVKNDHGEIRKSGKFWDLQWDLSMALIYFKDNVKKVFVKIGEKFSDVGKLRSYSAKINSELNKALGKFEKEKEVYSNVLLWELKDEKFSIRSLVSTIAGTKHPDRFVFILMKKGNKYIVSGRRQDKKGNVKEFLEKNMKGIKGSFAGGHVAAGGGHFLVKDLDKFKHNLRNNNI